MMEAYAEKPFECPSSAILIKMFLHFSDASYFVAVDGQT
jgi:hypothetical protein